MNAVLPPVDDAVLHHAGAAHSRFVQRVRRRYADELHRLPPGAPTPEAMRALVADLQASGRELGAALRVARQLLIERLAVLDVEQRVPLDVVTGAMTDWAELSLDLALAAGHAELRERHGVVRNADGAPVDFWVMGMGKLGARELNVSSDIDLIYVYEEDGDSDGPVPLAAAEYFGRLAKRLHTLIGDVTDDGQVFRMDLALRPNGNSGAPAVSLAALETYSWCRARVGAPGLAEEPRGRPARPGQPAARAAAAQPRHALRLPALPRLLGVREPASVAPQDSRRGPAPRRRAA